MSRKYKQEQRPSRSSGEYLHLIRGDKAAVGDFSLLLREGPKKLPSEIWGRIKERLRRPPHVQLALNLKITIGKLVEDDMRQVMESGLIKEEYEVLDHLNKLSTAAQLAAWELFTIQARQDLVDSFRELFQDYRTKKGFIPKT